jgi:hypothetical protein
MGGAALCGHFVLEYLKVFTEHNFDIDNQYLSFKFYISVLSCSRVQILRTAPLEGD